MSNAQTTKIDELIASIADLTKRIEVLETAAKKPDVKEMTKEHALQVLNGDMKDLKHKDAAEKLGLTYGQIYSCRLEFTFKDVHKTLKAEGYKNPWTKA
jgi:hypothetical protein